MTVSEFLKVTRSVEEISFIHDNCQIEVIDCNAPGSAKAVRAHYDEEIKRIFAIGDGKFRIDSK